MGDPPHDTAATQAMELLASMTSLGISPSLCGQVQAALLDLQRLQKEAGGPQSQQAVAAAIPRNPQQAGGGPAHAGQAAAAVQKVAELEGKLETSRSIMRKLYYRNVELEKELQLQQAGSVLLTSVDAGLAAARSSPASTSSAADEHARPSTAPGATHQQHPDANVPYRALQEKERTIHELRAALDAARRRSALLEERLSGSGVATAASSHQHSEEMVREAMAQSNMHFRKYRQIREDYNRLLTRRSEAVQRSNSTNVAAKEVVQQLRSRLQREVEEREAEAAIYSARLYETEKQASDWYVEKRMLEEHIARLTGQMRERDRLDGEIETCVAGLFERIKMLETTNEELSRRLAASGVLGSGAALGPAGDPLEDVGNQPAVVQTPGSGSCPPEQPPGAAAIDDTPSAASIASSC